jgi:TonB family protein
MCKSAVVLLVMSGIAGAQNVAEVWSLAHPGCTGQVYQIGNGILAPVLITKIEPTYTEEARRAKREGTIVLLAVVDTTGRTCSMRVDKSLGLGLDQAALHAVSHWRFKPGLKDGKQVSVVTHLEVVFKLQKTPH